MQYVSGKHYVNTLFDGVTPTYSGSAKLAFEIRGVVKDGEKLLLLAMGLGFAPAILEDVVIVGPQQLAASEKLIDEPGEVQVGTAVVLFQGVIKVDSVDENGHVWSKVVSGDVGTYIWYSSSLAGMSGRCEAMRREYTVTGRGPTSG